MSHTAPAGLDTRNLFCFKDRTRYDYVRVLASRPLYRCTGPCQGTREIHELGIPGISGVVRPLAAQPWPIKRQPVKSTPSTPIREEPVARLETRRERLNQIKGKVTMPKSTLHQAIEKIVSDALAPFEERLAKLEAAPKAVKIDKEIVRAQVESVISEQLDVAGPSRAKPGRVVPKNKSKGKRPRNPDCHHRGSCGAKCFKPGGAH